MSPIRTFSTRQNPWPGFWEKQRQNQKAVEPLAEAAQQKGLVLDGLCGPSWLRIERRLAQLCRKTGREEEAQKIEADLSRLLAYADHAGMQSTNASGGAEFLDTAATAS